MKASEFITERKKRKRRPRYAAYGPGPYGGYGYYAGYSGDSGSEGGGDGGGGGESINHEAAYPGNIGMMELAKFFSMADEEQKTMFKQLLERGKKGLAWKLVQDIVGVKLQGSEFAEGFFGIDDKIKGRIQNVVSDLSDIPGMWDHKAQTFTDAGMDKLKTVLKNNPKYIKYALNLDYRDYEAEGVAENFADGKNPQDKGDSKRHGINTKGSVSSLRKTAKQGGRKGQLAHWLANMKAGRAKKK